MYIFLLFSFLFSFFIYLFIFAADYLSLLSELLCAEAFELLWLELSLMVP